MLLAALVVGNLATPTGAKAFFLAKPYLEVSTSGERSDNRRLDGAAINYGSNIAVALGPLWMNVRQVDFYVNGRHVQRERVWPYDMAGTSSNLLTPHLFDVEGLRTGRNVIEARVRPHFGWSRTVRATFDVLPPYPSPAAMYGFDFREAEAALDAIVDRGPPFNNRLNGGGLVVVHPDYGIVHESYRGEITPDRVSLLASTSKVISAGVLMHLQDEGLLDIDRPISDYVPWGRHLPGVTTAQLLSNSSGLPGLAEGYLFNPCNLLAGVKIEDCAELTAKNPLDDFLSGPPDRKYRYGGPQWQIAGAVAEAVSGKTWNQLVEEIYTDPCDLDVLGYSQPFLGAAPLYLSGLAGLPYPGGFDGIVSRLPITDNPLIEGGGYTTPRDYAKLLLMFLDDGICGPTRVLSASAIDTMMEDRIGAVYGGTVSSTEGYGLGWRVDQATGDVRDPGLFGAEAWIDQDDNFAGYFVIEAVGKGLDSGGLRRAVERAMKAGLARRRRRP